MLRYMIVSTLMTLAPIASAVEPIWGFYPYADIKVGYKIEEPDYVVYNGEKLNVSFGAKETSVLELGFEKDNFSFGVKHDSQWFSGSPFNEDEEYYKTEIFIGYKIGGQP